jgi:calcineurin-like phosphoesterase
MKDQYIFVVLADIHIGQYDPAEHYAKELVHILNEINSMKNIDTIFIAGDYFHAAYSLESQETKYGLFFIMQIVEICKSHNAKLRIIKGTKSHDNNQLESFNFISELIDYRYIESVTDELLYPNCKVLYVPEEYITDKYEYYKEYMNKEKEYDLVIFHGLFETAIPIIKESTSEIHLPKAPVFLINDFKNCCKGLCIGGHIHKHMKIDDYIYYVGSLSRSAHGEETDKGYCVLGYDTTSSNSILHFKNNKYAKVYKVFKINDSFKDMDVKTMIKNIEIIKEKFNCDYLRIDIDQDVKDDTFQANLLLLREYYQNNKSISIRLNVQKKRIQELKDEEEDIDKISEEYKFLLDGTPLNEQMVQFAKLSFDRSITKEDVDKYINNEE